MSRHRFCRSGLFEKSRFCKIFLFLPLTTIVPFIQSNSSFFIPFTLLYPFVVVYRASTAILATLVKLPINMGVLTISAIRRSHSQSCIIKVFHCYKIVHPVVILHAHKSIHGGHFLNSSSMCRFHLFY